MFDYIMFMSYGSVLLGIIFFARIISGIASWYYYEKTNIGKIDYLTNYTLKGIRIANYNIGKNFIYTVICILLYFSIK